MLMYRVARRGRGARGSSRRRRVQVRYRRRLSSDT